MSVNKTWLIVREYFKKVTSFLLYQSLKNNLKKIQCSKMSDSVYNNFYK